MRILYSHRIQSRDGQGVHLDAMVAAMRAAGHEVQVVGPGAYDRAELGGESGLIIALRRHMPGFVWEIAELCYSIPAYLRLKRAAEAFKPDAIYERYNLFFLSGAWLAKRLGLPFLVEVNAPLAEERGKFGGLALPALARWSEAYVWRRADRVLPVTRVLGDYVVAAGVSDSRIVVVPNGIDLEEFAATAARDASASREKVTLGFVGFLRSWHGMDRVIRALATWQGKPRIDLVIAGDGPAREELETLTRELGLGDRVRFAGLVKREGIPAMVASFDIALQPASVAYASPLKVFEYMAAARAIVAPDQPNIREVLEHERTALLFDPKREGAMWEAVQRLVEDAPLRARLGAGARAEILARDMTWTGNARRAVGLFEEEFARRGSARGSKA